MAFVTTSLRKEVEWTLLLHAVPTLVPIVFLILSPEDLYN
jgi:hypothetical protein